MTIPERKSTWPQKDSDVYGVGCQSNKYRKDNIQFAARFFAHCVKPFLLPWTAVTTSSCDAVQNDGRCEVVPHLPREIKVDVTKCHACHAEVKRRHGRHGGVNPAQGRYPEPSVPRLSRKTTVDARLCHACHVKSRWMSPSAVCVRVCVCLCGCVLL